MIFAVFHCSGIVFWSYISLIVAIVFVSLFLPQKQPFLEFLPGNNYPDSHHLQGVWNLPHKFHLYLINSFIRPFHNFMTSYLFWPSSLFILWVSSLFNPGRSYCQLSYGSWVERLLLFTCAFLHKCYETIMFGRLTHTQCRCALLFPSFTFIFCNITISCSLIPKVNIRCSFTCVSLV